MDNFSKISTHPFINAWSAAWTGETSKTQLPLQGWKNFPLFFLFYFCPLSPNFHFFCCPFVSDLSLSHYLDSRRAPRILKVRAFNLGSISSFKGGTFPGVPLTGSWTTCTSLTQVGPTSLRGSLRGKRSCMHKGCQQIKPPEKLRLKLFQEQR